MPTILVVDDDDGVRRVIEDCLTSSGFEVVPASDTLMALNELASHPEVDLCLVDLVMPNNVPDGVDFARTVKGRMPSTPVILMTGYYSAALKIDGVADSLLYKPISLDELITEVGRLLAS